MLKMALWSVYRGSQQCFQTKEYAKTYQDNNDAKKDRSLFFQLYYHRSCGSGNVPIKAQNGRGKS